MSKSCFSALALRFGFEAAMCVGAVRNSLRLATQRGMAVSRFLAAVYSATDSRKSYSNCCVKVANDALAADFSSILALIFLSKFHFTLEELRSGSKICYTRSYGSLPHLL